MFRYSGGGRRNGGGTSFYLFGAKGAGGAPLQGSRTYRLHVPPKIPARHFWAVCDQEATFIRGSPKVGVNSYQDLRTNADNSADVQFSPSVPAGLPGHPGGAVTLEAAAAAP